MAGMLAIANVGRAAAFRSGYFPRNVVPVWINGAARAGTIQESISIELNTGEEPHRASFDFKGGSGFVPVAGQSVVIGHGSTANYLFAGRIRTVRKQIRRAVEHRPVYRVDCAGHMFELGMSRVATGFYAQSLSPRSMVAGLFAACSPNPLHLGYRLDWIDPALPVVSGLTSGPTETIGEALSRLFRSADAVWYLDHAKTFHAFGAYDHSPWFTPSTITSANSSVWAVDYSYTDLSRVFTAVQVLGAGQPIEADIDTQYHKTMPLASASILGTFITDAGFAGKFLYSDEDFIIGTEARLQDDGIQTPDSTLRAGNASVFLTSSRQTNTLTVVAANTSSMSPLVEERWYTIAGQYVYVASVTGVFSATASSIAYSYWVPSSISGALLSDVNAFAEISSTWNYQFNNSIPVTPRFEAGTQVRVLAIGAGDANTVSSLLGTTSLGGNIARTFDDGRLSPSGAREVADAAIERGTPSQWTTVGLSTRDPSFDVGRPIYLSMTSFGEPGAHSIAGTFTVQDVQIGGFGRLTPTKGPERTVSAGAVRKPTLWQVLQGV